MMTRDPLKILAERLIAQKLADAEIFARIEAEVKSEIEAGVQFALNAPYPTPDQVSQDVYA
jgi:pyruvate dehydrogenase E1 component alpha subunit